MFENLASAPRTPRALKNPDLVFDVVWQWPNRGTQIYDVSLQRTAGPFEKWPHEALEKQCRHGPFMYVIQAMLSELPSNGPILICCDFADRLVHGLPGLIRLLKRIRHPKQKLGVVLHLPPLHRVVVDYAKHLTSQTLDRLITLLKENKSCPTHWIIAEPGTRYTQMQYPMILTELISLNNCQIFFMSAGTNKPSIWGLYQARYEDRAVTAKPTVQADTKPVKIVCVNQLAPVDLLQTLRYRLDHSAEVMF